MKESTVNPVPSNPDSEEEYQLEEYLTDDVEMDNDERGTFHAGDITPVPLSMPAPQQNTAASAGTVVLFHRNPDSPLFKVGNKRPAQEEGEDEEHRKQKEEMRKNQMRVHVRAIQICNGFVC